MRSSDKWSVPMIACFSSSFSAICEQLCLAFYSSPSCLSCLSCLQAVSNVRKVLKKLRRETWKLQTHRMCLDSWYILTHLDTYPVSGGDFSTASSISKSSQCLFLFGALLATITVWASWRFSFFALHPGLLTCSPPSLYQFVSIKIVSINMNRQ